MSQPNDAKFVLFRDGLLQYWYGMCFSAFSDGEKEAGEQDEARSAE